ncbi:carboxypeptidase-like regulatory domain-containing protein [Robertkochia marina]|uniref:carboxypeptidase-like regulatory domain-containing protein n=1 Tax=Robertkochia marina TaxID=1227945 RepID=UPI001454C200|nr:carboxypeptidase-like regulatory domain-containing protein [Robertkochia marina]
MKKLVLLLGLVLGTSLFTKAQSVSGKIVDEAQNPVPYATIQMGDRYGVISNIDGEFTLVVREPAETDTVIISYLGFESLKIPAVQFTEKTYVLKEQVTELDEVLVSNKQLSPEEIIAKMLDAAPQLYAGDDRSQVFFMRNQENQRLIDFTFEIDKASKSSRADLKTINQEIGELTESIVGSRFRFFTEYYGDYIKWEDSSKLKVEKAVILKDKDRDMSAEEITKKLINTVRPYLENDATYKVKTGIIKIEDSLKTDEMFEEDIDSVKGKTRYVKSSLRWRLKGHNEFYKDDDLDFFRKQNRYEYTLEGYSNIGGESVYVISFTPDRGSAQFRGKMYINVFDFALMRLEYEMLEGERLQNINLKFLLGIKYREDRVKVTSEYRKNKEGKYYLKFGRKSSGMYAYISRPLKFIKNRTEASSDRQVFKMDFTFEIDNVSSSEIYIVESREITADDYKSFETQENFEPVEIEAYDASIWEGYNIIAPIEAIRTYGKTEVY